MRVVDGIEVEPVEEEILRLLRRGEARKDPGAETLDLVRAAVDEARSLASPRGVYGFFERDRLPDHAVFRSASIVGLCVSTIGPSLEERVRERIAAGDLTRAVVLDAVGSEIAEAAARVLDERMESEGAGDDRRAGARFSPGYGEWGLDGQRLVFDLLDAGRVGVTLSSTLMMTPRKSVSFAVNFGTDPVPPRCSTLCGRCEMKDCPYRRE